MDLVTKGATFSRALLAASVACSAPLAAASSSSIPDARALRALAAQDLRIASIGHKLARANLHLCGTQTMRTGLILHDLTQYDAAIRPVVAKTFSLGAGIGISGVVAGSTGARAGLQPDDEIVAVNGVGVEEIGKRQDRHGSYVRVEAVSKLLKTALGSAPVRLSVRHAGSTREVVLRGEPGCASEFSLTPSGSVNAWSDGNYVVVTTAIADFAKTDDELAFVVAHEMSHNILEHGSDADEERSGFLAMFSRGAGDSKAAEIEADAYAVKLVANAGYAPLGGISFLQRSGNRMWWGASITHPGIKRRVDTVTAAAAALRLQSAEASARAAIPAGFTTARLEVR